jgi:hypothetical protein
MGEGRRNDPNIVCIYESKKNKIFFELLEGKDYFMIQTGVSERAGVFPSFPPACPS